MKKALGFIGMAALTAGLMVAQTTTTELPGQHRGMVDRMTRVLNLTSDQATALQTYMTSVHTASQPIHAQLRTDEQALMNAAKANPEADLTALSAAVAKDLAQLTALHAQAYARFYNTLTPAQKTQADALPEGHMGMFEGRFGGGPGR